MKALLNHLMLVLVAFTLMALPVTEAHAQLGGIQGNQPQAVNDEASRDSSTGLEYDSEGMAFKTKEVKTSDVMNGDFLTLVLLLAIGVFVGRLMRYVKWTGDTRLAIAASVIMVGATIMALMGARSRINADTYKVEIRQDGSVNNMQADAIREQAQSYRELESLAGKKWKIEAAGAAAFTGAAVFAMVRHAQLTAAIASCERATEVGTANAYTASVCAAAVGPAKLAQAGIQAAEFAPTSCMGKLIADQKAAAAASTAAPCPVAAGPCKLAMAKKLSEMTCDPAGGAAYSSPELQEYYASNPAEKHFQGLLGGLVNDQHVFDLWKLSNSNSFPYERLFYPRLPTDDSLLTADKLVRYEQLRFEQGAISSTSVEEVSLKLSQSLKLTDETLKVTHTQQQRRLFSLLTEAAIPSAHAWGAKEFGLGGGIALVFVGAYTKLGASLDRMMTGPKGRSTVYGVAAGISAAAAVISKRAEGQYGKNADKLEGLLEDMYRLQNMPLAYTGQRQQMPGAAGVLPNSAVRPSRLTAEGEKTPCMHVVNSDGSCKSFSSELGKSSDFSDMGAQMASFVGLTGKVADSFMDSDSLSAGDMANVEALANQQAFANSALRQARAQNDELLKKLGLNSFDHENAVKGLRDDLRKAVISSQRENPQGFNQLASALGFGDRSSAPTDARANEALAEAAESVLSEGMADAGVDIPTMDFKFDFDEGFAFDDSRAVFNEQGMMVDIKGSDYEATGDIVNNRDVSLFQIITVRYFKSGFPRLFELKD
jgi:hypothetical protein